MKWSLAGVVNGPMCAVSRDRPSPLPHGPRQRCLHEGKSGALRVAAKQMAVKDALARSVCDRNQVEDRWYDTVIDVDYAVH